MKPPPAPKPATAFGKWALALLIANEIRGLIMVAPIAWQMFG